MKVIISITGDETRKLEPEDERNIRRILDDDDERSVAGEIAYYLDHITSDVYTNTDVIIKDDDGTVLFDGEL